MAFEQSMTIIKASLKSSHSIYKAHVLNMLFQHNNYSKTINEEDPTVDLVGGSGYHHL